MTTTADPETTELEVVAFDTGELDAALGQLIDVIGRLADGDLHRAHFDGGWTVAQVVSHINVSAMMWLGDLARLRCDPDLWFFFREEVGHDLTGYPPPTVEIAVGQLTSTRRSLATSLIAMTAGLADRVVEIRDLGTRNVAEWTPLIAGHLIMHTGQVTGILTNREVMPAGR